MDIRNVRVLRRIRPTRLVPRTLQDLDEEGYFYDAPASPEESYAVRLPDTPPPTPADSEEPGPSQQLSPARSEEPCESLAEMEVPQGSDENTPPDESLSYGSDDPDAPLSSWLRKIEFFRCLESAVLHLIGKALRLYVQEKCNGCLINHPSQRQHTCLFDRDEDLYQTGFHGVMRKLWTPSFIRAVEKYMKNYGFCEEVCSATEVLLLSYKSGGSIYERIEKMYENIKPDKQRIERFEKLVLDSEY